MKEGFIRGIEAFVTISATYMSSITMVQTTLFIKIMDKIRNSFVGPLLEPYLPYFDIAIVLIALFTSFSLWRKGDDVSFSRIFSFNMLMFFPSVLDFSTFNWVGLIFDLKPLFSVSHLWVFMVGLLLQLSYLVLRYTVRFRHTRYELYGRGANESDINDISRGQVGYLVALVSITTVLTAGIYYIVPYMTRYAQSPLSTIPIPHILVGFLVVLVIAATMIIYLRDG